MAAVRVTSLIDDPPLFGCGRIDSMSLSSVTVPKSNSLESDKFNSKISTSLFT